MGGNVTDYKTGAEPPKAEEIVLGRGADQPRRHRPLNVDQAIADIGAHVTSAIDLLNRGVAFPGPDARED
jgi:hypothetical protein